MTDVVDQVARDQAQLAMYKQGQHAALTELHLKTIEERIADVRRAVLWGGGVIFSVILTVLGWALVQQYAANESQKNELSQQIELLQQAEQARLLRQNQLAPSATETVRPTFTP